MSLKSYMTEDSLDQLLKRSEYGNVTDDTDMLEKALKTNLNGIFGIPYQFLADTDRRLNGTEIGRKYAEKIVARLPLLFITPGKQVFMKDFSSGDRSAVLNYLMSGFNNDSVSSLISGQGRYYSFAFDYSTYYNYVNAMCHSVARFMGLNKEVTIGGHKSNINKFDWSKAVSDNYKSFWSAKENIIFYLDGMTQVSESFGNSTTESSLASTINGFSDTANEIQFLLGRDDNSVVSKMLNKSTEVSDTILSSLSSTIGNMGGGLLQSLCNSGVSTVLQGGKIVFPEIWQDSTYDRSYSLDIKLRSPDHDSLSIYLNIIVPYLHLVALCLPRSIEDDPNAYTSPFLVKAFCKGMFSVDMGMVTSMSVTKGAECCWNDDGLPTQIDVSLEIKDLYSSLYMSGYNKDSNLDLFKEMRAIKFITSNTAMMDYLANMAGLNLAQMEIGRRIGMAFHLTASNFRNWPSKVWTRMDNKISNMIGSLYSKL